MNLCLSCGEYSGCPRTALPARGLPRPDSPLFAVSYLIFDVTLQFFGFRLIGALMDDKVDLLTCLCDTGSNAATDTALFARLYRLLVPGLNCLSRRFTQACAGAVAAVVADLHARGSIVSAALLSHRSPPLCLLAPVCVHSERG